MSCFDTAMVIGQSREPLPPASTIPRTSADRRHTDRLRAGSPGCRPASRHSPQALALHEVTGRDGSDAGPSNAQLVAVTLNVNVIPEGSPLTDAEVARPPAIKISPICGREATA